MIGDRVTVYLNDVLVVDSVALENYWDRSIPIFTEGSDRTPIAQYSSLLQKHLHPRNPATEADLSPGVCSTAST